MGFNRREESKTAPWWAGGSHGTDFTSPECFTSWRDTAETKERWEARWSISPNGTEAKKSIFGLIIHAVDTYDGGRIVRITDPTSNAPFRRCVIGKRNGLFVKAAFETNTDADQIKRLGEGNLSGWEIIFPEGPNWWE